MEPVSTTITVIQLIDSILSLVSITLRTLQELRDIPADAAELQKLVRTVELVVKDAKNTHAEVQQGSATWAAFEHICGAMSECQQLVQSLASKGWIVKLLRSGEYIRDLERAGTKLVSSLSMLHSALDIKQYADVMHELVQLRSLHQMQSLASEVKSAVDQAVAPPGGGIAVGVPVNAGATRPGATAMVIDVIRQASMSAGGSGAAGVYAGQGLGSIASALRREVEGLRRENKPDTAQYLERVAAILECGDAAPHPGGPVGFAGNHGSYYSSNISSNTSSGNTSSGGGYGAWLPSNAPATQLGGAAAAGAVAADVCNKQLRDAAAHGDLPAVQQAIQRGANPNAKNPADGDTALHVAARNGHMDVVEALLLAGANRDLTNDAGKTPKKVASEMGRFEIEKKLKRRGKFMRR